MENMIDTDVDTLQRCTDLKKADQSQQQEQSGNALKFDPWRLLMCKDQNRNGPFRGTAINITKLGLACSSFPQIVRSTKNVMRAQLRILFYFSLAFECLPAVEEFAALRVPASDPGVGGPGCG